MLGGGLIALDMKSESNDLPKLAMMTKKYSRYAVRLVSLIMNGQIIATIRGIIAYIGVPPVIDNCIAVPLDYAIDKWETPPHIAVICHMYYPDMADEFRGYLLNIPYSFDLFITTDTKEKQLDIQNGFAQWRKGHVDVHVVPNRGRDIAPKLVACKDVYGQYEYFLHIHTKKSPHAESLGEWRTYLLQNLLGSEALVYSVFEAFRVDPDLGMIAPPHYKTLHKRVGWGLNFKQGKDIAMRMGISISKQRSIDFPSGSMFWGRSAALKPLLDCNFMLEEFPAEKKQKDETLAHVIERIYFYSCEKAGFRWVKIVNIIEQNGHIKSAKIDNSEDLKKFIAKGSGLL
ncbi:MAG: hypothetical protein H0W44_00595 [Gammaproteobacteria bacterium]|nr:hypothetical protein [Gammaproteobacteria bacterium]